MQPSSLFHNIMSACTYCLFVEAVLMTYIGESL